MVAGGDLTLESLALRPGQKSLSLPLYKTSPSDSTRDDSTVKVHNPTPHGVRFGTLYLTVTTKVQETVYRWFWQSLLNYIHTVSALHPQHRSPSSFPPPRSPRSPREGLIGSGEIFPDDFNPNDDYEDTILSTLPPLDPIVGNTVTSENLRDMILLLGIETSDEEFEEMCASLDLERPFHHNSPIRHRATSSNALDDEGKPSASPTGPIGGSTSTKSQPPSRNVLPHPLRPHIPVEEFLGHFLNVLPRRPAAPHSSEAKVLAKEGETSAAERHESSSAVTSLFLGTQLDHDEYIWETALVNDHARITHLVVGQQLRPSALLLQTADASTYGPSALSTSPPLGTSPLSQFSSYSVGTSPPGRTSVLTSTSPPPFFSSPSPVSFSSSSSVASSSSPTGVSAVGSGSGGRQGLLRSSLSSAYGFFSRFSASSIKERRKDVIFVQDRVTGRVVEEKMPQYLRRMLRGMYSNPTGRQLVNRGMSKSLLKRLTFNQAKKYTAPSSVSEIPDFIAFHNIDPSEFLDPVESFANFNEFFIRKLRLGARPIFLQDDPAWAICPADCRLHVYESLNDAQKLWIKGKTFSLRTLLDNADLERDFAGCSLVIARLAPQDYHRFHYPVGGFSGQYFSQGDAYYTVNPIAVRENVDVYSLNKRTSVIVESPEFGRVMIICIGATMVGSVILTSGEDVFVHKGDELGYFQFGGSTLLVLFQRDRIRFDDDLLFNSAKQQETLVKMGMSLGKATRSVATSSSSA